MRFRPAAGGAEAKAANEAEKQAANQKQELDQALLQIKRRQVGKWRWRRSTG